MDEELKKLLAQIDAIEKSIASFQNQAGEQIKNFGTVSDDVQASIEKLGVEQHEIAERLIMIEQNGAPSNSNNVAFVSMGKQYTDSDQYQAYISGSASKARFEVQANTLVGADANVAPDRKEGIVPGDSQILTLESLFPSVPTSSNAIEYTREASFTNNAAEAAEAAEKGESALTWALVNMPVSTVAHWIKISRQLAADAPALAAYVNLRMIYGVNRRVETQLAIGNGTPPNISGITDSGNFTAHGYAAAALGTLKKFVLIRKIIADLWGSGYFADAIVLNPADFATMDIDQFDVATNNLVRFNVNALGQTTLFGIPIVQSAGMTADLFVVGAFAQTGTIYNREGVIVEMSDSDDDNFTKNLVTIRAERRLALTIERPTGIIGGDLTPA